MPYINQLVNLRDFGSLKNKEFMKELYSAELSDVEKFFDKYDPKIDCLRRLPDPAMTLDYFLRFIKRDSLISLQLASPDPDKIRYAVRAFDSERIDRFFFLECPYTDDNFEKVSGIYRRSFGEDITKEPTPQGLKDYYDQQVEVMKRMRKNI